MMLRENSCFMNIKNVVRFAHHAMLHYHNQCPSFLLVTVPLLADAAWMEPVFEFSNRLDDDDEKLIDYFMTSVLYYYHEFIITN